MRSSRSSTASSSPTSPTALPVVAGELQQAVFLADAGARFAASYRATSPETTRTYNSVVADFVAFVVQDLQMAPTSAALREDVVVDYVAHLTAGPTPAAPSTIAKKLSALRGLVEYLARRGVDVDLGVLEVKATAGEPPVPRALTRAGDSLLAAPDLRTVKGKRDSAILHVLMRAGLRRRELVRLTIGDYRLRPGLDEPDPRSHKAKRARRHDDTPRSPRTAQAAAAAVGCSVGRMALVVSHSKRGRSRIVPLDVTTAQRIDEWLATAIGTQLVQRGAHAPLFCGVYRRGGAYSALTPGQVANVVKAYTPAVAGVDPERVTPHALRHTFCTAAALHPKGGIRRVQTLAGHADLRTSARYVDVDLNDAATAVSAVWD